MARTKKIDPRKIELSDLQFVAESPSGRRVLGRFIAKSGMFASPFHIEERLHVLAEGERQFGIWIYNELKEIQPELPLTILREYYYDNGNSGTNSNGTDERPDFREPTADRPELGSNK